MGVIIFDIALAIVIFTFYFWMMNGFSFHYHKKELIGLSVGLSQFGVVQYCGKCKTYLLDYQSKNGIMTRPISEEEIKIVKKNLKIK